MEICGGKLVFFSRCWTVPAFFHCACHFFHVDFGFHFCSCSFSCGFWCSFLSLSFQFLFHLDVGFHFLAFKCSCCQPFFVIYFFCVHVFIHVHFSLFIWFLDLCFLFIVLHCAVLNVFPACVYSTFKLFLLQKVRIIFQDILAEEQSKHCQ